MKLRLARKICNTVNTPRWDAYTEAQKRRANGRLSRTKSDKAAQACWNALMRALGPLGRAQVVKTWSPGDALNILVRTPEETWPGDPTALSGWVSLDDDRAGK